MRRTITAIVAFVLGACVCSASPRIITVDDDGQADFATIQPAIDDANDGDTVEIRPGTYTGEGNRDIDFKGKAITVRSIDPTDPGIVAETVIDCNAVEMHRRGFNFVSGEGRDSVLAGVTITNGTGRLEEILNLSGTVDLHPVAGAIFCNQSSPTITHCNIRGNYAEYLGGGIYNYECSPEILNCIFRENGGGIGGAIYNFQSSPAISECHFSKNDAGHAAGIFNYHSSPSITNCTFHENSSRNHGAAVTFEGRSEDNPVLAHCTFTANSSREGNAGAVFNRDESGLIISNCTFMHNSAWGRAGAIYNLEASPLVNDCLIVENSAGEDGGAIYNNCGLSQKRADPTIVNCTISNNSAGLEGGGIGARGRIMDTGPPNPTVVNCIVWGNSDKRGTIESSQIYVPIGGSTNISFSCIQGWTGTLAGAGAGNIDVDPAFVHPLTGDYHISPNSPCIDSGDPDYTPFAGQIDLDGEPRVMDGRVDMGVDEFPGSGCVCPTSPRIITVDDDGPADFATIQAAIDDANDGDTVLVADGNYTGDGNRDIDFNGKAITVTSANGAQTCIIDCNGTEADPHRGFYFHNSETTDSILRGVTITGGYARDGEGFTKAGGGMYIEDSGPTITDCIFTGNSANSGGGVRISHASGARVVNCTYTGNTAEFNGGGISVYTCSPIVTDCIFTGNSGNRGGGMAFSSSRTDVHNCTFTDNTAESGGAIHSSLYGQIGVTNCMFTGNSADIEGGAILMTIHQYTGYQTVEDCTFTGNTAESGGALLGIGNFTVNRCRFIHNTALGGGGFFGVGGPAVSNCIFTGNDAELGGGMFGDGTLTNCTFAGNRARDNAAGFYCFQGSTLTNCIFFNGGDEIWNEDDMTVAYCDIENGQAGVHDPCNTVLWGDGNIDVDPYFVDPGCWSDPCNTPADSNDDIWIEGDYHLKSQGGRWSPDEGRWRIDEVTSHCIDAGDPLSLLGGEPLPNGDIINMGAYGATIEASKSWFAGPSCEVIIAGDINADCIVDLRDFYFTGMNWLLDKRPYETIAAGDINGDYIVDFSDFSIMAMNWMRRE